MKYVRNSLAALLAAAAGMVFMPAAAYGASEGREAAEAIGQESAVPVPGYALKDGTYPIEAESSSSMFRIVRAELTVKDGSMKAAVTLGGKGYLKLFMGTGEEALDADPSQYLSLIHIATGTPISMIVWNRDQRSRDYSEIADCYRPGHADYTFDEKFGFRDYRGGGRSSARETIGRVAAGAIAEKFLKALNISVCAYTRSIGPVEISSGPLAPGAEALKTAAENPLYMPDPEAAERAARYLEERMADQDSCLLYTSQV